MKKLGIMIMTLLMVITFNSFTQAQNTKSPKATAEGKILKVTYNRPSLRGRKVGQELAPYGKVWRTGADAATLVTFNKNVKFGGKNVDAGTYSLYTIPAEKEWTVILNKQTGQWGTEYNQSQDLLRVQAPAKKSKSMEETFTIQVDEKGNKADLVMMWENTMVSVPVEQR
jgi:hypothetical protein